MRNFRFSISLLLLFFITTSHSQITEGNFADCDKYNKFLRTTTSITTLNNFAEEIRSDGTIIFDQNKINGFNGISDIYNPLRLTSDHTFVKTGEYISRINNLKKTIRYQQYFKGIKVEGGGYSERKPNGPGPDQPCLELYSLTPYLATDINIGTNPSISSTQIKSVLENQLGVSIATNNIISSELVISPNILNDCQYKLAWKVTYVNQNNKISWVDANSGIILKTIKGNVDINAPTITYGIQNLNDRFDGTRTHLESPNGNIRIFDGNCILLIPQNGGNWSNNLIPNTTNNTWSTEATQNAYQTFHVTSQVIPLFQNLGINFDNVNISVCNEEGAFSLNGSTVQNAFLNIGTLNNRPLSLFDAIAHELGHTYLNQFLDFNQLGNGSLHEGISDIIGTFIESLVQGGSIDWIIGDDEPLVANDPRLNRNLSLPSCLTSVEQEVHRRGVPIGHLFFLLTQGDASLGISPLGAQRTINIILDALADVPRNADYPQLRAAILNNVLDEFGRCSNEFISFARAFENICVPTGLAVNGIVPACNFTLSGPNQVCEESNYLQICVQGGLPNATYNWTIIGPQSTGFKSTHGMQGNAQYGGNCLSLISFPQYPYYPQYITIEVYSPTVGPNFNQKKRIRIIDCDHDDPTCAEYYSLPRSKPESQISTQNDIEPIKMRVCDIMGRTLYFGSIVQKEEFINYRSFELLIFQYFDKESKIVKTEKLIKY